MQHIELIRVLITQLPDRQRDAVLLHYLQGFSYEQCSEAMGITVQAFKSLLDRARSSFKEMFENSQQ
jgi:RNA polymerase sigma-70 factor (ECF subfamily)